MRLHEDEEAGGRKSDETLAEGVSTAINYRLSGSMIRGESGSDGTRRKTRHLELPFARMCHSRFRLWLSKASEVAPHGHLI